MITRRKQVAIIGGGVIGLTCAYRLLEAGYGVTLLARTLTPGTTSDVAAAYWSPAATGGDVMAKAWALDSLAMFRELSDVAASGVAILDFYKLNGEPTPMPYMANAGAVTEIAPGQFPGDWTGYQTKVPRIDVPVYMPWLQARVEALGGFIFHRILQRFGEIKNEFSVIVNCAGLGARLLTGDNVYPIRGQVMSVRKPADFPNQIISADSAEGTTYIIARSRDCLLGGTYQYYDGEVAVDPAISAAILDRCARFYPALAETEIFQHKVGLRPGRDAVRLERERLPSGQLLIHNYGHGSIGHTLSWGCAADVVRQVQAEDV